jgi:hypothetical protein
MNLKKITFVIVLLAISSVHIVLGQDDACPAFVFEMLDTVSSNCTEVGRGEVCYGNPKLATEFSGSAEKFTQPSNVADVTNLIKLSGSALNLNNEEWGISLMHILANIPKTFQAMGLQFMFVGDVSVTNLVNPDDIIEVDYVDVIANSSANLRTGPSTNFGVGGSVSSGATLTAIGLNETREWVQVLFDDDVKLWVANFLVNGDLSSLPIVSDETIFSAMQAFSFKATAGDVGCDGEPPNHMLVKSPDGVDVNFIVNGVKIEGSARSVIWFSDENVMTITTFSGNFVVDALGTAAAVSTGFQVDILLEEDENGNLIPVLTPQNYRPYDPEVWKWYDYTGDANGLIELLKFDLPPEPVILVQSADAPIGPDGQPLGDGDVQVTLTWDTLADMDVSVSAPTGEYIYFGDRSVPSGGQLDVDSNFPCGRNTYQVENIFWPIGQAPTGNYTVIVNQYSNCASSDARWTLTVRIDRQVVLQRDGVGGRQQFNFSYRG